MKTDLTPPALDPETPGIPGVDRFAHFAVYRLKGALDCLGYGSMGITYRAHDLQLDRDVALKVINKDHIHDPHLRERFFREARAAARLQHPHIASVLYYGEEARVCFYVMEIVRGENLDTYINRVGPLAPRHALAIAHQVLLALDAAYQAKLLHRDLKPGNIMVANYHDNRAPHAKVIDFGLAKFVAEAPGPHFTKYGLFGTPGFASPEQWKGLPIDHRSDLYSLGATLWFLLTGRAPFTEDQAQNMRKAKIFAEPALDGLDDFPLELQHLLLRLLAASPEERPSTPMETANEIQDILRRLEGTALPATVSPAAQELATSEAPPPKTPARKTSLASRMVSALVCLALVAAVSALILQARNPSETIAAESDAPQTFRNSLGMEFVPVTGVPGLVSVWETRVRDYASFIQATGDPGAAGLPSTYVKWDQPQFQQTPDHPVVFVNSQDADRFCRWLTQKERDAGVIETRQSYRLPTHAEFTKLLNRPASEFFWGTQWPPPNNVSNFAGVETKLAQPTFQTIENYRDGFAETAPVTSFRASESGLHGLAGNVREITSDRDGDVPQISRAGAGWASFQPMEFRAGDRFPISPADSSHDLGFRCLLVTEP